jgi:hypothetical protein
LLRGFKIEPLKQLSEAEQKQTKEFREKKIEENPTSPESKASQDIFTPPNASITPDVVSRLNLQAVEEDINDCLTKGVRYMPPKVEGMTEEEVYSVIAPIYIAVQKKLKKFLPELSQKPEDDKTQVSFFCDIKKKAIGEQIFKDNKHQFVIFEDSTGNISYADSYRDIYPLENEAITKKCVLLATDIEKFGDLQELITEIQDFVHKYVDLSPDFEKFAVFYILLSYLYDKINTIPILRVMGDTGTGKTRFTDVVGKLCYKPMLIAGALTPAPIFRLIEMVKGTLIVEEADLSFHKSQSDETQAIVKIFNCGFEKGKPVMRCNPNNVAELNFYDVYCPKILATRQRFQDQATESRCLTEIMKPTQRQDIPTNLLADFYAEQEKLRNKLLYFRLKNYFGFEQKELHLKDLPIEPRLKQAFEAFACLFVSMPDVLEKFKAFLASYQKEIIEERADSFDGQIVNHLFDLIGEGNTEISTKDIAGCMGSDVKASTIGRRLKPLGFEVKVIFREGKTKRIIVLDAKHLEILKKRYVVNIATNADVTDVTVISDT